MKNTLILLIYFVFSYQIQAQIVEATSTIPINEYLDLLATNLELPNEFNEKYTGKNIDLTIVLTITKDGSVFNPKIQNDSLKLESSLRNAVKLLPKWNPKTENGIAVISRKALNLVIPIGVQEQKNEMISEAIPEKGKMNFMHQFARKFDVGKSNLDEHIREIKMIATFVIEKDGSLTNIKITESNSPFLQSEAIRVIKSMPKWKPATENGIPIRSDFTLPITIKINK